MEQYPENYTRQLKQLLAIINDSIEGFKMAAEKTNSAELRDIFLRYVRQREEMSAELKEKIAGMGEAAENDHGDYQGEAHRSLLNFKLAFTKGDKDEQAILETCRTGEHFALDTYDDILQGSILETDLKPFLMDQRLKISEAFDEMDRLYFSNFKKSPE